MTEIDVPDWVTKVAEDARVHCLNAVTAYGSAGVDERYHMAMKAALTAALEGWLVHEGWKYEGIYSSVPPFRKDRADGYTSPLYTIRKEPAA